MKKYKFQWAHIVIFIGIFLCFMIDYYLLHYVVITKAIIFSGILIAGIVGTLQWKYYRTKMDLLTFLAYNYSGVASCFITLLLMLNFFITPGEEKIEEYKIFAIRTNILRDAGYSDGSSATEAVIVLKGFAYADYVNIRSFDYSKYYNKIALSNTVRFHFKRGLFSFRVLKDFEFLNIPT